MGCHDKEPDLNDLFADPIVQAMMHRDSVKEHDLRGLLDRLRQSMAVAERIESRPVLAESAHR